MRPTVFGMVVALVLVVAAALRPPVADPSVTGLVWAGLAGAVVLGVLWPVINVRMIGVRVVAAPTDLVVGQLATVELELTGRASGLSIGATGSGAAVIDVVSPGVIRIPLTIGHRGAYQRIRVDVGSDAPFGVLFANRTRLVDLPRQLLVGPEPVAHPAVPGELPGDLQDPMPSGHGSTGEAVRSVRPYVVGDPAHLVHWPSTARTGSLVVRELEPPAAKGLAIVVDLRAPGSVRRHRVGGVGHRRGCRPADDRPGDRTHRRSGRRSCGIGDGAGRPCGVVHRRGIGPGRGRGRRSAGRRPPPGARRRRRTAGGSRRLAHAVPAVRRPRRRCRPGREGDS